MKAIDALLGAYVYYVRPEYQDEFQHEAPDIIGTYGPLVLTRTPVEDPIFADDVWLTPFIAPCESITKGACELRRRGKYWYACIIEKARRTTLITEALPRLRTPELIFPCHDYPGAIGVFGLLNEHWIIGSQARSHRLPNGAFVVREDRVAPPNRAYLKLWEALSYGEKLPQPGDRAIDLGASPGGWTWVLQQLGVQVLAIDKAPLAPHIAALRGVAYRQGSAFSIQPTDEGPVDWLVCDVACYPERLLNLLTAWLQEGQVKHMIATIKLQGETDWNSLRQFQAIPDGRVIHLYQNKHEVTFLWPRTAFTRLSNQAPVGIDCQSEGN